MIYTTVWANTYSEVNVLRGKYARHTVLLKILNINEYNMYVLNKNNIMNPYKQFIMQLINIQIELLNFVTFMSLITGC